jgi:hypothetical protein
MVTELLDAIVSWRTLLIALVVFGFAPGALLRLIVLAFHRDDPRRRELLAELHAVPRLERPFWVFEQLEVALFEGVWKRLWEAAHRIIRRPKNPESAITWYKDWRSPAYGGVEVARTDDRVLVRDRRGEPIVQFTLTEWQAFVDSAREGEFDLPDKRVEDPEPGENERP